MSNLAKRDPDGKLLSKDASYSDNYPVIRLRRQITVRSLDSVEPMTTDGLFTAWRGYEISFECAYSDAMRSEPRVHSLVESEIEKVLRTLHFER